MKKIDMEKIKKVVKSKNFIIVACVIVLTIITISVSYAAFFTVKTNTANQSVTTGTLAVTYTEQSTAINRNNMSSMSDEMGLALTEASVIYIQNTGSLDSTFTITLGYDMENFLSSVGSNNEAELTPLDYVKVAIYEYNGTNDETLIVGPITISELPIYELNNSDSRYNRYSILFDSVGGTSSGDATKTYKVKMWLSDKAIPAASYSYFYLNAEVVAEVLNAKMSYNISGTLTDSAGSPLNEAVISLQNNSAVSTTDSSGAFNLNGIYPGVYNLNITYNGVTYKGNLTVTEGESNSLNSRGSTFSGDANTDIYNIAYNYGTTLTNILNANNITTYAAAATFVAGTSYNLRPTYELVGGANSDITGVGISLDTSTGMYSLTLN